MANTKLYTIIYVVLFVFATLQVAVEMTGYLDEMYWTAVGAIAVLSIIKAYFVAGYYQHLKFEPRSLTYLVLGGLVAVMFLTAAAAFSIT
ncbi:MAG: cytochrome C oxidase subunit IV family protein [Halobacteriales archaeon]|nr:cytochrome C oxidase subunit IV family protein [Halobacteriales archaeon]